MREILNHFAKRSAPHGLTLWTDRLEFPERHHSILTRLSRPDSQAVDVLKQSERRSVLRVKSFSLEHPSIIVKGFPLQKIESKWKYQKYGLAEFENYQRARQCQIPTPDCFGYFEVRRFGLVSANGVIIEDLRDYQSLAQLVKQRPEKRLDILSQAVPMLTLLFKKGVNHIDATPQNLLLHPDGLNLRLIDWRSCAFVPPEQPAHLLLTAAHFLRYAELPAESADGRAWLTDLIAESAKDVEPFIRKVAKIQHEPKLGSEMRLKLQLDPNLLAA